MSLAELLDRLEREPQFRLATCETHPLEDGLQPEPASPLACTSVTHETRSAGKLRGQRIDAGTWLVAMAVEDPEPSLDATFEVTSPNCSECRHLLRRGTCAEPVAAGLVESFGIVWPLDGHAATCASYSGKTTAPAQVRPFKLTKAQADDAHADPWDDASIARQDHNEVDGLAILHWPIDQAPT